MIAEHSAIVARGMGVRRGGRWLLRPVTFGVTEGVVGFAGPPGVGKSTLLATFATLRRPNSGVLHILGHDITNAADLRAARARIGYLPARFSRAESMTAGEFVAYAAYYKRTSTSVARSIMKRLDLAEAAGTALSLLPPDVRLRAGLAAACVHGPDLLVLDDPFGDLRAAAEPWPTGAAGPGGTAYSAAMAELVPVLRSLAPTVLVSADDTETLTGWCDRLLTLARGRLSEQPTHSAAARRGRTAADRRVAADVPGAARPVTDEPVAGPADRPAGAGLGTEAGRSADLAVREPDAAAHAPKEHARRRTGRQRRAAAVRRRPARLALPRVDLRPAVLRQAVLRQAVLRQAVLRQAVLRQAAALRGTALRPAALRQVAVPRLRPRRAAAGSGAGV
ncbi:ATP-binding cassette domain-containing protein [Actinomadura nitritigenes]|uniref:ATP-binding cassette domain-containing protein n=1 Tax=Actinomadura nitritigenes TaxID=134602 RepID=A0ABS3QXA2_9ACTN|nr:ATP-binding cassette domain-containing protein [Actinomadura nitritigenes]